MAIQNDHTKIRPKKEYRSLFCICSIVNDMNEYKLMKESFAGAGFSGSCSYLIADNTIGNNFDAYAAIRRFLQESDGEYTIIVHQDVRCIDHVDMLRSSVAALDQKDPSWAICGNAGAADYKKMYYHLDNAGSIKKSPGLPAKVFSLDENLLIVKTAALLSLSADINGFHFYGTDLCLVADALGYSAYVIPFMVKHLSKGNLEAMEEAKPAFIKKYGYKLRSRFVQTNCTNFYLGSSPAKTGRKNNRFIFFWVKAKTRLMNALRG